MCRGGVQWGAGDCASKIGAGAGTVGFWRSWSRMSRSSSVQPTKVRRVTRDRHLIAFLNSSKSSGSGSSGSKSSSGPPPGRRYPASMKPFTTPEEAAWLKGKIPGWHRTRLTKKVAGWLTTTTSTFLDAFPTHQPSHYKGAYAVSTFSLRAIRLH